MSAFNLKSGDGVGTEEVMSNEVAMAYCLKKAKGLMPPKYLLYYTCLKNYFAYLVKSDKKFKQLDLWITIS